MTQFRKWQLDSVGYQQTFYERFGDRTWDLISKNDTNFLYALNTKVSYTLFGKPFEVCTEDETKYVENTRNKVIELSGDGDVHFGCIFICVLLKKTKDPYIFSLIRVKKTYGNEIFFVERQPGRVYRNFNDFLSNNKLPKCDMCYPENGFYTAHDGRVRVRFRESPSCNMTFKVLDVASLIGKVASTGLIAIASFFPVITPIVATGALTLLGTTTYSSTRSIIHLLDRNKHHQSVSLVDKDARILWLEMCNDIINGVLAGGAAALPRLLNSGRLALSAVEVSKMLSWVSLGVNGFGIVTNVASIIVKFRNGTLERSDVEVLITSCLFIGNLIVSITIANHIIREVSEQPSHMYKFFKMAVNTPFQATKSIIASISVETALKMICGETAQSFFTNFDMPYSGAIIGGVRDVMLKFQQKKCNPVELCFELLKLMTNHLQQVRAEIEEGMQKLNSYCDMLTNKTLSVNGRALFRKSRLHAPEVVHSIDDAIQNLNIPDDVIKKNFACVIMTLASKLSREINVNDELQFSNVCKILTNEIKNRCNHRLILCKSERQLVSTYDKEIILDEVLTELRNEFRNKIVFPAGTEQVASKSNDLGLRLLYNVENVDVYAFEASSNHREFDQFIDTAACKLLNVDCLPDDTYIHCDNERTMMIRVGNKSLVFFYERQDNVNFVIGMAMVKADAS